MENLRGFTREVVIEVTANIESQELRRLQNEVIVYPEHPRAGSTEDLECFFGVAHSKLGTVFTLKEFKDGWPKLVRYLHVAYGKLSISKQHLSLKPVVIMCTAVKSPCVAFPCKSDKKTPTPHSGIPPKGQ